MTVDLGVAEQSFALYRHHNPGDGLWWDMVFSMLAELRAHREAQPAFKALMEAVDKHRLLFSDTEIVLLYQVWRTARAALENVEAIAAVKGEV